MKLLINICSYDGIASHYTGVGTIVKRFIDIISRMGINSELNFDMNLITVENNESSLGYNKKLEYYHKNLPNTKVIKVSNGSGGATSFGTIENWKILSQNTAKEINKIDSNKYDKVITIAHDTPYCSLFEQINKTDNHTLVWLPHSTVKIHGQSSDLGKSNYDLEMRLDYELGVVNYINNNKNIFLGVTGKFIANHLIKEYGLKKEKIIEIINGEILSLKTEYEYTKECKELFKTINKCEEIVLSFGRAEKYKNLEATMLLGKILNIKPVVIAQGYYKGQPIIEDYEKLAKETSTQLFVDVPFNFPQYILSHFNKKIIMLIPSKKEIMGLVFNEVRKFNKGNILIVANNIDGIKEQVTDGLDGLLVDLNNIEQSAAKVKRYFNERDMQRINKNAQNRIKRDYNYEKNCMNFIKEILKK